MKSKDGITVSGSKCQARLTFFSSGSIFPGGIRNRSEIIRQITTFLKDSKEN